MVLNILVGNKRDNVIRKLRNSKVALFWLILSWIYLYGIWGVVGSIHLQEIFVIGIAGVLLVNLLYVPYRLMLDSKIKSDIKLLFTMVFLFILIYYLRNASECSVRFIFGSLVSIIIISLCVTGFLIALVKVLSVHAQRNVKRVYGRDYDTMDGHDFEYFCADMLQRRGFQNVEVTQGSGDYGIDIIAYRDGLKYGIQCKRYSGSVGWRAVEEAHAGAVYYGCDRAVVLTNSDFTKHAMQGASRIGVLLWGRNWIENGV